VGHLESSFGSFEDSVSVGADRCTVCAKRTIGSENHFGRTGWYSEVTRLKWMLVLVCLEIVLILTQDRCMFVPNV
jgi:hypothetical protein